MSQVQAQTGPVKKKINSRPTIQDLKSMGIDTEGLCIPRHNLSVVKGQDALVKKFKDQITIINDPDLKRDYLTLLGRKSFQKYYLLEGPTGSGKTYLAEAYAGSLKNAFFWVVESNTLKNSQYINSTQINIERMFAKIRRITQAGFTLVVLMDEIDSFLMSRNSNTEQSVTSENNDIVNRFLTFLDGAKGKPNNLIFFGTTNRFDQLDSAAVRPGRFERLTVDYPAIEGVEAIVKQYLLKNFENSGLVFRPQMANTIATLFDGASPAAIKETVESTYENLVNEFILLYNQEKPPNCSARSYIFHNQERFLDRWIMDIFTQR
ncbi:MAG: ATP-binding protein [Patescibacteria group bacterium]